MQYRLRTLLIVLALGPPIIASVVHCRNWRALQRMRALERATWKRDELLNAWRETYDHRGAEEVAIRHQYYAAWRDVETAKGAIKSRYGSLEAARQRAAQAEKFER
jgi:hypothetical protein